MPDSIFSGLFTSAVGTVSLPGFLVCLAVSLILGAVIAVSYTYRTSYSKSFVVTLATIPAIVCVIILMVSGSLGASVAVAGTFSLIRFRSAPGTAKEIGALLLASAVGIACGMGYPLFAAIFAVVLCAVDLFYRAIRFGERKNDLLCKTLKITVPEDLDYGTVLTEPFRKYTTEYTLIRVKTTNLGSLNRLTYNITLRDASMEKELLDELRTRNGNLEISISLQSVENEL